MKNCNIKKLFAVFVFFTMFFTMSAESFSTTSSMNSIRTYFGPHKEIAELIYKKTGIKIEYTGLTFFIDKIYLSVMDANLSFLESTKMDSHDYIFTIPYIYDDCVMVSRTEKSMDVIMNYENKRYITYRDNPFGDELAEAFGIEYYDDSCASVADAFAQIVRGDSDYTFVPSRLAYLLREELDFTDVLTISHPIFGIEYRFIMKENDFEKLELVNEALMEMLESGEIDSVYLKFGLRSRVEPYIKSNTGFTALIGILFVILFSVIFVLLKLREKNHWREL